MKSYSPLVHLGIGLILFLLTFALFSFLPNVLPYPEPISPPTYMVIAILGFIALFFLKERHLRWIYLPIPLITFFGFLEESSYGVEGGIFQPLYWEEYHVQVYDLHNLFPVLLQIANTTLEKNHWDFALFQQLRSIDVLILLSLVLFVLISGARRLRGNPVTLRPNLIRSLAIFGILISLSSIVWLLLLPSDAKNALLFGYSPFRISLTTFFILIGVLPAWLMLFGKVENRDHRIYRVVNVFEEHKARILIAALGLFALGLAWQGWAPLNSAANLAVIQRLNPFFIWLSTMSSLFLIALWSWNGNLGNQLDRLTNFVITFPKRHPAYIYVLMGVILVVFAQAMDQGRISLSQFLPLVNLWGEDWNTFIEETAELIGAYELALAIFFFTIGRPKDKSGDKSRK